MKWHIFTYRIISQDTRNLKASNILQTREKEKIYENSESFQNTPVLHIIQ